MNRIKEFITKDIWTIRAKSLSGVQLFCVKMLRIILLSLRGFKEDKCQLRASALTFFSLLSVVPVVAMAFGIAKGFGFENMLEDLLTDKLQGQEEVVAKIIAFAQTFLDNTKGGLIAGIGILILVWTVIKVLGNIEHSFNDIWGIKQPRPMSRKFSDYLAIMFICPVLLILSSSMTVFITTEITLITEKISLLGVISPLIFFFLRLLPYTVLWLLFSFIYIVMPNTRVNISSGIVGGVIAGTVYQLVQWVYVAFQIGASKYGAIYGSFAALPLFLIWLQLSWLIVLFGAESAFAHQNVDTYEFEPQSLKASRAFRRLVALRVVALLAKTFAHAEKPLTVLDIIKQLDVPVRLLRDILFELTEAGIVTITKDEKAHMHAYQPGCDVNLLSVHYVLNALDTHGATGLPLHDSPELETLKSSLQSFDGMIKSSNANVLLKDI